MRAAPIRQKRNKGMVEFLHGEALSRRIREVVKGKNLFCAVAFWGNGAVQELFGESPLTRQDVKIVCDLSMGATSPETLKQLGAPNNINLRHYPGLHAKVYCSDVGMIVGSANASNNGIGFMDEGPDLLETGVYLKPGRTAWQQASYWFKDDFWDNAQQIDNAALQFCKARWHARKRAGMYANPPQGRLPSFLKVLRDNPWLFGKVAFVFSTAPVPRKQLRNARFEADEQSIPEELIRGADVYGAFGTNNIDQWPLRFINLHRPNNRIGVHFRMRGTMVAGTHFARRSGIKQFTDLSPHMTGQIDHDILAQCKTEMDSIFDDGEPRIWSADEVSKRIFRRREH